MLRHHKSLLHYNFNLHDCLLISIYQSSYCTSFSRNITSHHKLVWTDTHTHKRLCLSLQLLFCHSVCSITKDLRFIKESVLGLQSVQDRVNEIRKNVNPILYRRDVFFNPLSEFKNVLFSNPSSLP